MAAVDYFSQHCNLVERMTSSIELKAPYIKLGEGYWAGADSGLLERGAATSKKGHTPQR
jgi:hypothetical protein